MSLQHDAINHLIVTPVDVLYLRGNLLFGAASGHSEALMPPWPSVMAGAIRSRMLVDSQVDLAAFAGNAGPPPGRIGEALGTPAKPGTFSVAGVALADELNAYVPLPADLVVHRPLRHRGPGARPPAGSCAGNLGVLSSSAHLRPPVLPLRQGGASRSMGCGWTQPG